MITIHRSVNCQGLPVVVWVKKNVGMSKVYQDKG